MKSFITGGLLVASLALIGNTAMAATLPAHKHAPVVRHIVQRLPQGQANGDIGQFFQSIFGGQPMQYSRLTARASRQSQGSYGSPSYDSSPAVDTSSASTDAQAASDAEVQAIQSMNDENALNASTAAAEAANDAANAATVQTEINANN
jgi:hypothetical protein